MALVPKYWFLNLIYFNIYIFIIAEINKKKKTNLDDEKRRKILEAEEAKKIKLNQQTLESTQTLSQMETRIFNEL